MEKIKKSENASTLVDKINKNFESLSFGTQETVPESNIFIGNLSPDWNWASQSEIICPVCDDYTIKFHLPANIVARIKYGVDQHPNVTSDYIYNGGTFTFPKGANTQTIQFAFLLKTDITCIPIVVTDPEFFSAVDSVDLFPQRLVVQIVKIETSDHVDSVLRVRICPGYCSHSLPDTYPVRCGDFVLPFISEFCTHPSFLLSCSSVIPCKRVHFKEFILLNGLFALKSSVSCFSVCLILCYLTVEI